jgi:PAS domain S-box-containing protein
MLEESFSFSYAIMTVSAFLSSPSALAIGGYLCLAIVVVVLYRSRRQALAVCRRAEERIVDAENRFTLAFQHNTIPMCISEWEGTIRDVNQVFCEISGYSPEELVGKNSLALGLWCRPEEQRTRMVALLRQYGRVRDLEVELRNKAGVVVPTQLSVSLLTINGASCLLSTIHDLTATKKMADDRRKFEQHMAQTKNLEAMGALVGGLAHQFNNILTGIIGYSELALDDVGADSQTAGDLERILEKAAEAKQLVQQILAFSGEQALAKQHLDFSRFVDGIVRELRNVASQGLKVEARFFGEIPWVHADPIHLHLAILNICRNAIESMPEGGVLIVGLQCPAGAGERFADVDADLPAGEYAHLYIKDKGQGMDHLTLERIFNPFFTTKQPGQGTGMGLSVAHGIIHAHGGIMRVNSREGYGSTFHLFFPVSGGGIDEQAF